MKFFDKYVLINTQAYEAAEAELSRVANSFPEGSPEFEAAADRVMVAAMNAATAAYHMADHIFQKHSKTNPGVVYGATELKDYRDHLNQHKCIYLGAGNVVDDLTLLGAVTDAYKHLDLSNKSRPVTSANATGAGATGFGQLPWGEGKFGGTAEVIVRLNNGDIRAFSKVLENVIEMWKGEIQAHGL
jgi:hypothetical protein